ncbi:uncharacterized protein LOC131613393 [Vicia villosa]|uniref:uncharacterized protein LOC131613393 n=1 Tax=Vicia villosa TaxID=3911 RepID=UPI00273B2B18|nr:uncharacterized protein LOC131613393 [Vicia villosa]
MDWQRKNCSWILASVFKWRDKIKGINAWATVLKNGKYRTADVYKELRRNKGQVPWKHLMYQNYAKPRARFILWLSLLDRLNTKDMLLKRGSIIDVGCIFCKEMETVHHLFFECQVTNQIWRIVLQHIRYDKSPMGWTQERAWLNIKTKRKGWHGDLLKIAIAESVYGIWRHRNDVIFNQSQVDPHIWKTIVHDVLIRDSFHKSIRNHVNVETMSISL